MRTVVAAALVAVALIAGCGSSGPSVTGSPAAATNAVVATPSASVATAPTPEPTSTVAPAPTATPAPTGNPLVITGSIVNGDGTPIDGLAVFAQTVGGSSTNIADGTVGADGKFSLRFPAKGKWCVEAGTPLGQMTFGPSGWARKQMTNCLDVGTTVYPAINLKLPAGTKVSGKVVDARGRPLANQELTADSDAASNATKTDSKGRFSMLLLPGKYEIVVETEQGTQARKVLKVGKTAMTGVTVGG